MIEESINKLTAAIEALTAALPKSSPVYTNTITTPFKTPETTTTVEEPVKQEEPFKQEEPVKQERKSRPTPAPAPVPEVEVIEQKTTKEKVGIPDLTKLAQSILDLQGLELLRDLNKRHGIERISKTPEDKVQDVFADLLAIHLKLSAHGAQ